ncbi:MAG: DUF1501 domain-containing protein [Pirellulaceae bacterium]|nr:DUF1501 domain-containing protein [Pirellulaceae bacterium]
MSRSNSQANLEARRNLLKLGTCGAMTNATFLSTLMHLKMTSAVMADGPSIAPTGGYKALVCLFFNGAIDSFNVLTPFGTTQGDARYSEYASTRSGAALKRSLAWDGAWTGTDYGYLNPIVDSSAAGGTGRTFGLHPRFTYLKEMYDAGHATMVANCGSLVVPLANNNDYNNNFKVKPIGLFSHPDLQKHWQTAVPTSRNQVKGWGGKMMDLFTDPALAASQSNVYSAISTAGQSLLLTGNRINPYSISNVTTGVPNGGAVLSAGFTAPTDPQNAPYGNLPGNAYDRIYTKVQRDFASQTYTDILEKTSRDSSVGARDAAAAFQTAFLGTNGDLPPAPSVQFPTTGLGTSLNAVARAISIASNPSAAAPLKQDRQIFLVQVGGWDHHASVIANQDNMIPLIDNGLKAFYDFLISKNMLDKVTLFSISDFGRTFSFNGSGTDHGWGGNPIVMGGAVNATAGNNRIWGTYPNIVLNTSGTGIDRGRGVLIPQTSSDLYHADICRWFGMPANRLNEVLPNIGNFPYQGGSKPIGFLNYT